MTRCECCDLPVASCRKAAEDRQRLEERHERALLLARGWHVAQYPGSCIHCGERFEPETPIRMDRGGWRAQCRSEVSADGSPDQDGADRG